ARKRTARFAAQESLAASPKPQRRPLKPRGFPRPREVRRATKRDVRSARAPSPFLPERRGLHGLRSWLRRYRASAPLGPFSGTDAGVLGSVAEPNREWHTSPDRHESRKRECPTWFRPQKQICPSTFRRKRSRTPRYRRTGPRAYRVPAPATCMQPCLTTRHYRLRPCSASENSALAAPCFHLPMLSPSQSPGASPGHPESALYLRVSNRGE